MIYILSWTTKKHQKTLSRPLHSKLKKIQGLFKDFPLNLRSFQDCATLTLYPHFQKRLEATCNLSLLCFTMFYNVLQAV